MGIRRNWMAVIPLMIECIEKQCCWIQRLVREKSGGKLDENNISLSKRSVAVCNTSAADGPNWAIFSSEWTKIDCSFQVKLPAVSSDLNVVKNHLSTLGGMINTARELLHLPFLGKMIFGRKQEMFTGSFRTMWGCVLCCESFCGNLCVFGNWHNQTILFFGFIVLFNLGHILYTFLVTNSHCRCGADFI